MKTRILITIIIMVSIVLVVGSIFVGNNQKSSAKELLKEEKPGFTEITCVPGVAFYVNSSFIDTATAITQVSDNIGFKKNQYYSYKNGVDQYLLFNMEKLIVAVQKGTDFWIGESNDKEHALLNANIMNIWFTQGTKKFDSVTENGMTITKANAGVAINSTTYGDFCGELININKDGEEWSIFVGVPGERWDKLSDASQTGIDTIARSISFSNSSELLSQDIYAVSLDGDNTKQLVETKEEVFEYDDSSLNLSNQANIVDKNEELAYTSTPYNMLSLGDNGLLSVFNDREIIYEEAIICPIRVYRGAEAEAIIKEYCDTTGNYDYPKALDGQAWEVVEYDLNYRNCINDDYINLKIKGVDGEVLRYRGIKYNTRTYDMFHKQRQDGDWIRTCYSFYSVPNGCYEYCLECGEREAVNGEEVSAAYYHISNEVVHSEQNTEDVEGELHEEQDKK